MIELEKIGVALALILLHAHVNLIARNNFTDVFHDKLSRDEGLVCAQSPAPPVARKEDAATQK